MRFIKAKIFFLACITSVYKRMKYIGRRHPGFFKLHSIGFMQEEKAHRMQEMRQTRQRILDELCSVPKRDASIWTDAFTGSVHRKENLRISCSL